MRRFLTLGFVIISIFGTSFIANSQGPSAPDDIPDVLVTEATNYFIQDPKLFYLNSPVCAPIRAPDSNITPDETVGSVEQLIGRTAVHGAELREMYNFFYDPFCSPPDEPDIISDIVADDDYVYFVSDEQNALVKISENRLDWESTPSEVVYPHTARNSELVIVGDTIYILQTSFGSDGIYQVNKTTGVGSQLLTVGQTGTNPNRFQTDGIYLFWRFWTGTEWDLRNTISPRPPPRLPSPLAYTATTRWRGMSCISALRTSSAAMTMGPGLYLPRYTPARRHRRSRASTPTAAPCTSSSASYAPRPARGPIPFTA